MAERKIKTTDPSSNTVGFIGFSSSSAPATIKIDISGAAIATYEATGYEDAIYTYLQAIRALDRVTISNHEIADALSLPVGTVEVAMANLQSRGVEVA